MSLLLILFIVFIVLLVIFLFFRYLLSSTPSPVSCDLTDKVFVLTGASSGLGLATARALEARGALIVPLLRSPARLEPIKQACGGSDAHIDPVYCDLRNLSAVRSAAGEILSRHPKIDGLLNIAGVLRWSNVEERGSDGLEEHFAVNCAAGYVLGRALRQGLAEGKGRIVNVGSCTSALTEPEPGGAGIMAYGRSKSCVLCATEGEAKEWEDVTCLCVDPGVVRTGITRNAKAWIAWLWDLLPIAPTPEQGAQTLLYVAQEETDKLVSGGLYRNCKRVTFSGENGMRFSQEVRAKFWDFLETSVWKKLE